MKGLGFIGAGNMAEAMIRGILAARLLPPAEVYVHDVRAERKEDLRKRFGVSVARGTAHAVKECGTVVFGVKPPAVPDVLREISPAEAKGKLFLSIAAGVRARIFQAVLGPDSAVVRAMPNMPVQVGMGSTGLFFTPGVSDRQKDWARRIFSSFGSVAEMAREELLDVVTALSGSGPAYVFMFIEALADGAVRAGMGREEAVLLAASAVEGAARMVRETGRHPGQLKDLVTSPGGTTAAGLAVLEKGAFRGTVMDAVFAAWLRCRELSG
jgi:pyrroline-5-carboxylate reductase